MLGIRYCETMARLLPLVAVVDLLHTMSCARRLSQQIQTLKGVGAVVVEGLGLLAQPGCCMLLYH